jgi:3-hydroxyacyl-CoA dehydrogenase / enoyl-CoA hydratase / 3-hydroxybutyryl-CoA epimerase / enoyl-CoA isomerase
LSAGAVVEKLAKYAHLGKRFEPTESLLKLAKTGETFYPRPKLVQGS